MKLHLVHTFPGTRDLYWKGYNDPELDEAMASAGGSSRETVSEKTEGGVTELVQRFHINLELPMAVKKLIGSDKLSYDQTSRIDEANDRIEWDVKPPVQGDRVTAKGTVTIVEKNGQVERTISGDVIVKVPLVGGQIEKAIVKAIEEGYTNAAKLQQAWMAERA